MHEGGEGRLLGGGRQTLPLLTYVPCPRYDAGMAASGFPGGRRDCTGMIRARPALFPMRAGKENPHHEPAAH